MAQYKKAVVLSYNSKYVVDEIYIEPEDSIKEFGTGRTGTPGTSFRSDTPQQSVSKRNKKKLLHIDDGTQIRLLASVYLKKDYDVESVQNAELALKKIRDNKYDFFLVDINLGGDVDGFDIINEIRLMDNYQTTPVIVLTVFSYDWVRDRCIEVRADAYLQKPFDKKYLIKTIQSLNKR